MVQLATSRLTASITCVSHGVRIAAIQRSRSVSHVSKYLANVGNVSTPIAVARKYPTITSQNLPVRPS